MGLYDRDYYRTPNRGGVGTVRLWSITTWLIVINIAVFLLDLILYRVQYQQRVQSGMNPFEAIFRHSWVWELCCFSIQRAVAGVQVWRLVTYAFFHAGIWHLVINMIGLWLFGPVVELNLGPRRFTFFYLVCVAAGPLMYAALWGLGILLPEAPEQIFFRDSDVPMVGASAGIFGVLLAAAYLSPDRLIFVYFFDIRLKYLAWIMVGLALVAVLMPGAANAGGEAAHLGGALAGFALIRTERLLDFVQPKRVVRGRRVKDWSRDMNR